MNILVISVLSQVEVSTGMCRLAFALRISITETVLKLSQINYLHIDIFALCTIHTGIENLYFGCPYHGSYFAQY